MFSISALRRYWHQNKYRIIAILVMIATIIIIIQVLNQIAKITMGDKTNIVSDTNIYRPDKTAISGGTLPKEQAQTNSSIIEYFIKFCNEGNKEQAYALLSTECKEAMFPTVKEFDEIYYSKIFSEKREYNIQSWMTVKSRYTYKVRILSDILSTGNYNKSQVYEDYMTIVKEDDGYKLNINKFIGKENINKEAEQDNIKVKVISKEMYYDYEVYNIRFENNTDNDIIIDSQEKINTVYLSNEDDVIYSSLLHELADSNLLVYSKTYTDVAIKFSKVYDENLKVDYMNFTDIILNKKEYFNQTNKEEYQDRTSIRVEI